MGKNDMDGFSIQKKLNPDEFYYSKEGYIVFTEKYLLKRGYCCKNGCTHCPYGFDPKKSVFEKTKNKI